MERYPITNHLSMSKLNLEKNRDLEFIKQLEKDDLICGDNGYLWQETYFFENQNYLQYDDIYNSPYLLYHYEIPIGYLEISKIYETFKKSFVFLSYALLQEARGHGYMKAILENISNDILLDRVNNIREVILMIQPQNIASQKVAMQAGFFCDEKEQKIEESLTYKKKERAYLLPFKL